MKSRFILVGCLITLFVMGLSGLPLNAEVSAGKVDDSKLEIYKLKNNEAAVVLPALKDIYANDPKVRMTAAAGKLFIRASEKQHKEITSLIKELDIKRKNVRIDVKFVGSGQQYDGGASLNPQGGVIYNKNGFSSNIAVKPSLHSTSTTTSSSTTQILMAMSGTRASLRIGEKIPYLSWIMDYGYRYGVVAANVEWQDVGSFLSVEPTIIGDGPMIRVKLVPELSGMVEGRYNQIRFVQAATEVTVRDGESVQIGGENKNSEFLSHFLVGFDKQGSSSTLNIVLTPRIMDDMTDYKNEMIKTHGRKKMNW